MSAHGRFTARPEESYRAALAPTLKTTSSECGLKLVNGSRFGA